MAHDFWAYGLTTKDQCSSCEGQAQWYINEEWVMCEVCGGTGFRDAREMTVEEAICHLAEKIEKLEEKIT